MREAEAKEIIRNYRPRKGFFDLSVKPKTLTLKEYATVIKIQNTLISENEKFKNRAVRVNNRRAWENLKKISGELQAVVFRHWNVFD